MKQPAIARLETSQVNTAQWRTLYRIAMALHKQLTLNLGDVDLVGHAEAGPPMGRSRPR